MADQPQYPDINGVYYGWSSVEISIAGDVTFGVKDVTYDDGAEPGEVRGTKSRIIARTRGEYKCTGGITLYKRNLAALLAKLGDGFGNKVFDVLVSYADIGQPTTSDKLVGCKIKKIADSPKAGSDAAECKIDLHVFQIERDGLVMFPDMRTS